MRIDARRFLSVGGAGSDYDGDSTGPSVERNLIFERSTWRKKASWARSRLPEASASTISRCSRLETDSPPVWSGQFYEPHWPNQKGSLQGNYRAV